MSNWSFSKSSAGQGLVGCCETGRTVAVTYDEKDAPLVAAAPQMLAALQAMRDDLKTLDLWHYYSQTDNIGLGGACDMLESAIAAATGEPAT